MPDHVWSTHGQRPPAQQAPKDIWTKDGDNHQSVVYASWELQLCKKCFHCIRCLNLDERQGAPQLPEAHQDSFARRMQMAWTTAGLKMARNGRSLQKSNEYRHKRNIAAPNTGKAWHSNSLNSPCFPIHCNTTTVKPDPAQKAKQLRTPIPAMPNFWSSSGALPGRPLGPFHKSAQWERPGTGSS